MNRHFLFSEYFKKLSATHVLVWCFYYYIMVAYFIYFLEASAAFVAAFAYLAFHILVFYINSYFLLPKFFEEKKYSLYFLSILILLIMSLIISIDFIPYSYQVDEIHNLEGFVEIEPDGDFEINHIAPIFDLEYLLYKFAPTLAILSISLMYRNVLYLRKKEKADTLQLKAESQFLKSQINPHFLFNTLNNIYSLSQVKSDKTPDAIHRLSKMLRYVLYESNSQYVDLYREIEYIERYIELYKLKDEEINNIQFIYPELMGNYKIAPMLLLPFVENALKHGNIDDPENAYLKIELSIKDSNFLLFQVENTVSGQADAKDSSSGIGLENVKRRLELIYSGRFDLKIGQSGKNFTVKLELRLKND